MEELRQYILSVITISLLCGIFQMFFAESNIGAIVKLITGLMITITVVSPIIRGSNLSFSAYFDSISADGELAVAIGEELAADTASAFIKDKTETYICDKASAMGAVISADVILTDDALSVPSEVTIKGNVSPYVKKQLSDWIQNDLCIDEDKQTWIS